MAMQVLLEDEGRREPTNCCSSFPNLMFLSPIKEVGFLLRTLPSNDFLYIINDPSKVSGAITGAKWILTTSL